MLALRRHHFRDFFSLVPDLSKRVSSTGRLRKKASFLHLENRRDFGSEKLTRATGDLIAHSDSTSRRRVTHRGSTVATQY